MTEEKTVTKKLTNTFYRFENRDYYLEYMRNYYIKNKAKMAQQSYEYRRKNRDYYIEYMRNYNHRKIREKPQKTQCKTPIIEYIEGPVRLYFT